MADKQTPGKKNESTRKPPVTEALQQEALPEELLIGHSRDLAALPDHPTVRSMRQAAVLQAQRRMGNQYVQWMLSQPTKIGIQLDHHPSEPRLAGLGVRREPLDRRVLIFSEAVNRARAIEHIWPNGFQPTIDYFLPDHNDPWANQEEGRYQRYIFDYGNPVARRTW